MTCAHCGHVSEPSETVRALTICPKCLATLIAESGARAIASDTLALDQAELAALRKLRSHLRAVRGVEA